MFLSQMQSASSANRTSEDSAQNLRYIGELKLRVRGSATGYVYQFSPVEPVQAVNPKDAQRLLATGLFRLSR